MTSALPQFEFGARRFRMLVALTITTIGSAGCGGGSDPNTGSLSLNLTDAPVDGASSVVFAFKGIDLQRTDGTTVSLDFGATGGRSNVESSDSIKLQNGVTGSLTQGAAIPAGQNEWMRLTVLADKNSQGESYFNLLTGQQYPLWIPSGS